MNDNGKPNLPEVKLFFNILNYAPTEQISWAYFDWDSGKVLPGCGTILGTRNQFEKEIQDLSGVTAHILISKHDGRGRKTENIVAPRAYFADVDRELTPMELKLILEAYRPNLAIETSPNRYHFYWNLNYLHDLATWSHIQAGIASYLESDLNMAYPTTLMRMPGFIRKTKAGELFTPQIISISYEVVSIYELFKDVTAKGEKLLKYSYAAKKKLLKNIKVNDLNPDCLAGIEKNSRNNTLYSVLKDAFSRGKLLEFDQGLSFIFSINQKIPKEAGGPLGKDELYTIVKSAFKRSEKARLKLQDNKKRMQTSLGEF